MMSEQGYARIRGVGRRQRPWVLGPALAVLAVGAFVIGSMKPVYKSQAILRALESQPHKDYVPPTVVEQQGERLKTLRLSVMSRPVLLAVAAELRLEQALHAGRDEVVDELRRRMEVKVEGEDTFLLTYEDSDAERSREVVNRVAARFVARLVEQREAAARATEEAISDELVHLRPELERREDAVRRFKLEHNGALPEQQEGNLRTLDQTTMELNILSTNLDLNEERRRQLLVASMSPMRHQEEQLTTALHDARTRYTAAHPEVRRIAAELDEVRRLRAADETERRAGSAGDPELATLGREIDRERSTLAGLRRRQELARQRLSQTAENGEGLARLTLDLDGVRARYQAAVAKLHDAQLASAVERGLRGLRYDNVETAARPLHPIRPNRPLLLVGAAVLALLVGLGVGFARDFADGSIHAPEELATLTRPAEVLACVPEMGVVRAMGKEARGHRFKGAGGGGGKGSGGNVDPEET